MTEATIRTLPSQSGVNIVDNVDNVGHKEPQCDRDCRYGAGAPRPWWRCETGSSRDEGGDGKL